MIPDTVDSRLIYIILSIDTALNYILKTVQFSC